MASASSFALLKADTKNVGGKAIGEMILGLPEGEALQESIIESFKESGLTVTEAKEYV